MTVWLGRWRIAGTNWEGRAWRLTAGAVQLCRQLNNLWPQSDPADGTVASSSHDDNNPGSDHRPKPYTGPGVVRAVDVGEASEGDGQQLFNMLLASRDPRIKYAQHEDQLFSSYARPHREPWEVQTAATFGHPGHVHISFTELADNDDSPWFDGQGVLLTMLAPCNQGDQGPHVRALQTMLVASDFDAGAIDGVYGPKTAAALLAMRQFRGSAATTGDYFDHYAYEQLLATHAIKMVEGYFDDIGADGGLTDAQARALIATHAANPDAHHE